MRGNIAGGNQNLMNENQLDRCLLAFQVRNEDMADRIRQRRHRTRLKINLLFGCGWIELAQDYYKRVTSS